VIHIVENEVVGACSAVIMRSISHGSTKDVQETLIDAGKEVGLEMNTGKTKFMLLSHYQNAGQNHDVRGKLRNRSFEDVVQFKY
jgi:hypothetical protein